MKNILPKHINTMALAEQVAVLMQCAPTLKGKIQAHCDLGTVFTPNDALLEVLKFMSLCELGQVLTPSQRVDDAWHQFILHTHLYHEYCAKCYHRYLHHMPSNDTPENEKQFEHTIACYQKKYGDPPSWFWGRHWQVSIVGDCSACESA